MAAYITVGAKTTHGGTVISGSPHTTHNGIPVARVGDKVLCKKCKKVVSIATGDPSYIVDGSPIARHGDMTSCGSTLIAIQHSFAESDFEVMGVEAAEEIKREAKRAYLKAMGDYEVNFQFLDDDEVPYVDIEYQAVNNATGEVYTGTTDEDGFTETFYSDSKDEFEVTLDLPWQKTTSD